MRERSIHTEQNEEYKMARVGDCIRAAWLRNSILDFVHAEAERKRAMKRGASRRLRDEPETDRKAKAVDRI